MRRIGLLLIGCVLASAGLAAAPRVGDENVAIPHVVPQPLGTQELLRYSAVLPYPELKSVVRMVKGRPKVVPGGWKVTERGAMFFYADLSVCAAGCTYTNTGFQSVLNDAAAGDSILLQSGFTYVATGGNPFTAFALRVKSCPANDSSCYVTIRTGVDATGNVLSSSLFPAADHRIDPSYSSVLAKFRQAEPNFEAIRTAHPGEIGNGCSAAPCLSNWYKFKWLEFVPNTPFAGGPMLAVGSNGGPFDVNQEDAGTNLTVHATTNTDVLPDGHTAVAADVGMWVYISGGTGFTTGTYRVRSIQGSYWRLNRSPAAAGTSGGTWFMANLQDRKADVPANFTLEQLLVCGDPVIGQFRGITLAADYVTLKDSYVCNIKSFSEGNALYIVNNLGPVTVTNNFFSGGSEVIFTGAADPYMQYEASIEASPAPTSTTARLEHVNDLTVNEYISVECSGAEKSVKVTAISGLDVTWTPALPCTPETPNSVNWASQFGGWTFTKNFVTTPITEMQPVVATPTGLTATAFTTGGTLPAGQRCYKLDGRHTVAQSQTGRSTPTAEVCATVASGTTGRIELTWNATTNVTQPYGGWYRIYAGASGAQNVYFASNTAGAAVATSFIDTGATGTSGSPPTVGNFFQKKNALETKVCDGLSDRGPCLIEGNWFENSWHQGQLGSCLLFKNTNQDGANDSVVTRNLTVRNNIIRNCTQAIEVCAGACELTSPGRNGGRMDGIYIRNNLMYDIHPDLFCNAPTGVGTDCQRQVRASIYWSAGGGIGFIANKNSDDVAIEHNTIIQSIDGGYAFYADTAPEGTVYPMTNFVYRDNLQRALFGWRATNEGGGQAAGIVSWNIATNSAGTWASNAIADANCSNYPLGTICPTEAQFQGYFENYGVKNFRCAALAGCDNAASDLTDIGANIDAIEAFTNIAVSGNNAAAEGAVGRPTRARIKIRRGEV